MRLQLHNFLGQCCFATNEQERATAHFRAGIEISEQSEKGRLITAFCLHWLGQTDAVIALTEAVAAENPNNIQAYQMQLKIYAGVRNQQKVREIADKISHLEQGSASEKRK